MKCCKYTSDNLLSFFSRHLPGRLWPQGADHGRKRDAWLDAHQVEIISLQICLFLSQLPHSPSVGFELYKIGKLSTFLSPNIFSSVEKLLQCWKTFPNWCLTAPYRIRQAICSLKSESDQ